MNRQTHNKRSTVKGLLYYHLLRFPGNGILTSQWQLDSLFDLKPAPFQTDLNVIILQERCPEPIPSSVCCSWPVGTVSTTATTTRPPLQVIPCAENIITGFNVVIDMLNQVTCCAKLRSIIQHMLMVVGSDHCIDTSANGPGKTDLAEAIPCRFNRHDRRVCMTPAGMFLFSSTDQWRPALRTGFIWHIYFAW